MILLGLLNSLIPKEIAFALVDRKRREDEAASRDDDPSLWRLRNAGDTCIDHRSSSDETDGDRGRPEFPTC